MGKKIIQKIMVVGLLISMLFMNVIYVRAMEINGDLSYEEGAVDYIPEDTAQREAEKLLNFRRIRAYPIAITLSVTWFKQQNGYYCGPATVKQVVNWINGNSESQDYYAGLLSTTRDGTNMTLIPGVLNTCIDEQHYVYSSIGTQDDWMEKIRYSMYYSRPAVLDINTNSITEFPYSSSGHFVNISGYSDKTNQVCITDPNDERGNVWYDKSVLYSANNNHFRQAIIW